jgi:hypothetical protein
LDWEPTDDVTTDDGTGMLFASIARFMDFTSSIFCCVAYSAFIDYFADRLHAENLQLSVDIATWSVIWNYPAMATTKADMFISMGTYTSTDSSFTSQLDKLVTAFGKLRLSIRLVIRFNCCTVLDGQVRPALVSVWKR